MARTIGFNVYFTLTLDWKRDSMLNRREDCDNSPTAVGGWTEMGAGKTVAQAFFACMERCKVNHPEDVLSRFYGEAAGFAVEYAADCANKTRYGRYYDGGTWSPGHRAFHLEIKRIKEGN